MSYFRVGTMSAPLLEMPTQLWSALIQHLRHQGDGVRESGAFLLGYKTSNGRLVERVLPYEQLQVDALHDDYVELTATSFTKLWNFCHREGLSVVADVHTHRFGAGQSRSDQCNPMVALSGHIALIVPRFAQGSVRLQDLGMYVYKGNHKWDNYLKNDLTRLVRFTGEKINDFQR